MNLDIQVYKIGTLARECGISPHLLRAWEKRYQLLAPIRGSGRQRLYTQDDLLLLRYLTRAIQNGARIGELAVLGRERLLFEARGTESFAAPALPPVRVEGAPTARLDLLLEELVAAAKSVDGARLQAALTQAEMELNLDSVVYDIIPRAMEQTGAACLSGTMGIAGEHLISNMVEQYLKNGLEKAHQSAKVAISKAKPVTICCCFPGEEHTIGLLTVAYALARQGWDVVFLGSSMPLPAMEESIQQTGAESIWLSVSDPVRYQKYRKDLAVVAGRQKIRFLIGGQGISKTDNALNLAGCEFCVPCFHIPEDVQRLAGKAGSAGTA
jgi:DNA-binding transcriptional MerR regulator